jgi:hypothetical protein
MTRKLLEAGGDTLSEVTWLKFVRRQCLISERKLFASGTDTFQKFETQVNSFKIVDLPVFERRILAQENPGSSTFKKINNDERQRPY